MAGAATHYERSGVAERILEGLRAAGVDPEAPTVDDLAPVDHFHTRAREATRDLARMAGLARGARVLDLGGGIGGAPACSPARPAAASRSSTSPRHTSRRAPS
jgi:hypothetical protein